MAPDKGQLFAGIANDAWMVRYYGPKPRNEFQRRQRAQAILKLGLTCREAFNSTEDFEPLFQAILDGLIPKEDPRF